LFLLSLHLLQAKCSQLLRLVRLVATKMYYR
jgi:hypothetical protein